MDFTAILPSCDLLGKSDSVENNIKGKQHAHHIQLPVVTSINLLKQPTMLDRPSICHSEDQRL